jgi:hypothetical protein
MNWIKHTHISITQFAASRIKQREFLWLLSGISLLIFGYNWYDGRADYISLIIAIALFIFSILFQRIVKPILYLWMFFGRILSEITSFIILAIIFIIGIIPIGIFYRLSKSKTGWDNVKEKTNFNEQF